MAARSKGTATVTLVKGKVCNSVVRYEGGTATDPFTNVYMAKGWLEAKSDPAKLTYHVSTATSDGAVKLTKGKVCQKVVRYEGGMDGDPMTNIYVTKDYLSAAGDPDALYFTIETN